MVHTVSFGPEYVIRRGKQKVVALVGNVHVTTGPDILAPIAFFNPRFERLVQERRCVARVPLVQALETQRVQLLLRQQAFQRMALRP